MPWPLAWPVLRRQRRRAEVGGRDRHRRAPGAGRRSRRGQEALQEAGYEDGKNLKWQYQSAQGNTGTAAQIARKFIGDKPDVIVGIATPSAQALVAATKSIPIVFSTVTDPVGAHLTPSWEASGTNVTGVSDMLALDKQIELIKKVVPGAKRIGMVYNPGEANSVVVVRS